MENQGVMKTKHGSNDKLNDYLQKQPPKVFYKKGVLRNFAKFTGKHLCQCLFFNNVSHNDCVSLFIC